MARTKKERACRCLENEICYSPVDRKKTDEPIINILELAEFEALRLCDLEGMSQIEAADEMKISRGTIQRILESGRKKLIDALLNHKCIKIKKNV